VEKKVSEARQENPAMSGSAESVEERAAAWIVARRDRNGWNEEKQGELDAWLTMSPTHMVAYLRLDAAWHRADWLSVLRRPIPDDGAETPLRRNFSFFSKIAAACVAVIAVGVGAYVMHSLPREQTYATPLGGHKTVILADGSQVELNTDTVLRTMMSGGQRTAWLDRGEAFFQIAHEPNRQFVVMAGARRVTVLGTKFLVRRETDRLEVAVVEGRVRFDAANGRQSRTALLAQGDVAIATPSNMILPKTTMRALTEELGWRRGVLVFDNTTLADAVNEFNRYNNMKLLIADAGTARLTIGGTFQANNVEAFTRVIQEALEIHKKRLGDVMVISAGPL
jgi:transmembrane sensor